MLGSRGWRSAKTMSAGASGMLQQAVFTQALRGIRTKSGADHVRWLPTDEKLTVLPAVLREGKVGTATAEKLRAEGRLPIAVLSRHPDKTKHSEQSLALSVCTKQIKAIIKAGRIYNQVFEIQVEGRSEPVKAVVAHLYRCSAYLEPLNLTLTEFQPGKRTKVHMPAWFDNRAEAFALRKGALLSKNDDYIPCYWRGGEFMPRGIIIDMDEARPPMTFRLDQASLPEGLVQRFPKHTHVLATLKGTRRYRQAVEGEAPPGEGEEVDDE